MEEKTVRKIVGSSLLVGAAAAGAIALSASAAVAAGTWTVTPGGAFTATGSSIAFRDTTTNQPFNCTASSINGTAKSGSGLTNPLAQITSGTFTGCTGNLGSTGTASISAGSLNGVSYNSTTGVTTGTITGVSAALVIHDILGTCNASVSGSANNVTYTNSTGVLKITADTTPALTIASASGSGCASLIRTGDKATFAATYTISPRMTVSSP